jgi:hypothetical protein
LKMLSRIRSDVGLVTFAGEARVLEPAIPPMILVIVCLA